MSSSLNHQSIHLFNFYALPQSLFQDLLDDAMERIAKRPHDLIDLTAEDLCMEGLWKNLYGDLRRLAGLAIAYMVKLGLLPLVKLKTKKNNRNQYRIVMANR